MSGGRHGIGSILCLDQNEGTSVAKGLAVRGEWSVVRATASSGSYLLRVHVGAGTSGAFTVDKWDDRLRPVGAPDRWLLLSTLAWASLRAMRGPGAVLPAVTILVTSAAGLPGITWLSVSWRMANISPVSTVRVTSTILSLTRAQLGPRV